MIILDTDCVSLFDREQIVESSPLYKKLKSFPADEISTTIITFEEQMRGWLVHLSRCKTVEQQVWAYERLTGFLESYKQISVVNFDERAMTVFKQLKLQKVRVGTMDLKIAAIAIANDAILITRNLKDFEIVPGLAVQDWT